MGCPNQDADELRPERALSTPIWWAALVVLAVNDHLLKALWGNAVTGKLSDVAGMVVAPPLCAALLRARTRGRIALCYALVGVVFAAIKLSPPLARSWEALTALAGFPWSVVCDPTDLLALPMLAASWHWLVPRMRRRVDVRRRLEQLGAIAGAVACMATSPARPPEPVPMPGKVAAQGWRDDPLFLVDVRTGQRSVRIDPDDDVLAALGKSGMLFVLEEERVVALSPRGKLLHQAALSDSVHAVLLSDDARLFVVEQAASNGEDETVIALRHRDLRRAWSHRVSGGKPSRTRAEQPAAGGGLVLVPLGNELYALDAVSGRPMWRHRARRTLLWPHASPGGVFVTDSAGIVYRLDAETGKEIWRRQFQVNGFADRHYEGAPLASSKGLLFVSDRNKLTALDPQTGQARWLRRNVLDVAVGDALVVARLREPHDTLVAFDAGDGRRRWFVNAELSLLSPPVIAGDDAVVLVRPHHEVLIGYDAASGRLLWRFDLDDGERVTDVGRAALVHRAARR